MTQKGVDMFFLILLTMIINVFGEMTNGKR